MASLDLLLWRPVAVIERQVHQLHAQVNSSQVQEQVTEGEEEEEEE